MIFLLDFSFLSFLSAYQLGNSTAKVKTYGVRVFIIDFTLSSLNDKEIAVYADFSEDMFTGEGDLQFDVYRDMKMLVELAHQEASYDGDDERYGNPVTGGVTVGYIRQGIVNYHSKVSNNKEIYCSKVSNSNFNFSQILKKIVFNTIKWRGGVWRDPFLIFYF